MFRSYALLVVALVVSVVPVVAGTLQGSLFYSGLPLAETFPNLSHGRVGAFNTDTNQWTFGDVDLASGTYIVDGLAGGTWFLKVLAGQSDLSDHFTARSGEISGWEYLELNEGATVTHDLAVYFAYRLTQPFDSTVQWNGPMFCPYGPTVPIDFTFAWDPVPRAESYEVLVNSNNCVTTLSTESMSVDGLSAKIQQGAIPDEAFISVQLRAFDANQQMITITPNITYVNGSAEGVYFQQGEIGRMPHPFSSVFVAQVAHLPGVAPSFWSSDLILSNPTTSDVKAQLNFTPRDTNGLVEYYEATVSIPARGCRVFADVVHSVFESEGAGSLEVSPSILEVSSRISTPAPDGGSYGQGFPAIRSDCVASLAGPVTILGVGGVARGDFRCNLALTEVWGETAGVTVRVLDRDGAVLGDLFLELLPFGNTQLNDIVGRVQGPQTLEEGQVTVTVVSGSGRVAAVLSKVDTVSQDPTTLVLEGR